MQKYIIPKITTVPRKEEQKTHIFGHRPQQDISQKSKNIWDILYWERQLVQTTKPRKAKADELIIFKNTHEAIIDEETWSNAQRLRKTVRRSPKYGTTSHPFTGLLICSDCGGKLSYREPAEHKEKKYDCDYCFVCQHYRHRKGSCSMHYIKVKTVNEILLKSIKEITDFAKEEK